MRRRLSLRKRFALPILFDFLGVPCDILPHTMYASHAAALPCRFHPCLCSFVLLRQASHIQAAKAQLREFLLTQAQSPRSGGVTGDATEAALRALDTVFSRDAASRQQQLEEGERVLEQRLAALEAKEVTKACTQSRHPHCPCTTQRISSTSCVWIFSFGFAFVVGDRPLFVPKPLPSRSSGSSLMHSLAAFATYKS